MSNVPLKRVIEVQENSPLHLHIKAVMQRFDRPYLSYEGGNYWISRITQGDRRKHVRVYLDLITIPV